MQATLYSYNKILGSVDLLITDESMGVLSGLLKSTQDYFLLRETFKHHQNNQHEAIKELRLNLELQNRWFIFPNHIYVEDFGIDENEITVYALGQPAQLLENYFKQTTYLPFVEEPWYAISIQQKLGLENELRSEIGEKSGNNKNHPLLDYNFSAFAIFGAADDVLFEISGENQEYSFAVVHLTWKGKLEVSEMWPRTDFYKNFDEFKYFRMFPDKAEWEL